MLLQQHNGRVSVTRLQLRLRTIRPGDASWCECCLKQSSCCPVRSARLFTLSICFLLLLKNPPVWFLPLKCNSFNLLNLFMMKTNRSSDRNTQGHVLSLSFFGESYISPQLPEHFSSDTAASSLCCVLSTVLFYVWNMLWGVHVENWSSEHTALYLWDSVFIQEFYFESSVTAD